MPEWHYEKLNLNNPPRKTEDIDILNDAGKDGWELVGITVNNIAYLKRDIPPPPKPTKTRPKARTGKCKIAT